jgi:hypothetical protein
LVKLCLAPELQRDIIYIIYIYNVF